LSSVNVQELIRAGVHFGHRTSRWNPKMAPYIFKKRNLIHIIDLKTTVRGLVTAKYVTEAIAAKGEYVLFVGTKRQAQPIVRREAERCQAPYVAERWPGGLLTNYVTIRKRLDRLIELEELERSGDINHYSKRMVSRLRRERHKIERNLGGVREMNRLPGLLVLVDPRREQIALREAIKLGIPTIAWIDTDGDPGDINVVVPANDDAIGSIEIFLTALGDAVLTGGEKGGLRPERRETPPAPKPAAPPVEAPAAEPAEQAAPEPGAEAPEAAPEAAAPETEQAPPE